MDYSDGLVVCRSFIELVCTNSNSKELMVDSNKSNINYTLYIRGDIMMFDLYIDDNV